MNAITSGARKEHGTMITQIEPVHVILNQMHLLNPAKKRILVSGFPLHTELILVITHQTRCNQQYPE